MITISLNGNEIAQAVGEYLAAKGYIVEEQIRMGVCTRGFRGQLANAELYCEATVISPPSQEQSDSDT